jgi:hypothetical protein
MAPPKHGSSQRSGMLCPNVESAIARILNLLLSEDHDKRTKEIKERQNKVRRGTVEHEHNFQMDKNKLNG